MKGRLDTKLVKPTRYTEKQTLTAFECVVPVILAEAKELKETYYNSDLALPNTLNALSAIILACSVLLEEVRLEKKDLGGRTS